MKTLCHRFFDVLVVTVAVEKNYFLTKVFEFYGNSDS